MSPFRGLTSDYQINQPLTEPMERLHKIPDGLLIRLSLLTGQVTGQVIPIHANKVKFNRVSPQTVDYAICKL